jgi:hypothetical protein
MLPMKFWSYNIQNWQGRRKQDQWFEVTSITKEKIEGKKKSNKMIFH